MDRHESNRHEGQGRTCAKRVADGLGLLHVQVDPLLHLPEVRQRYAPQAHSLLRRREVPGGASEREQKHGPHVSPARGLKRCAR